MSIRSNRRQRNSSASSSSSYSSSSSSFDLLKTTVYLLLLGLFFYISIINSKRIADETNLLQHVTALSLSFNSSLLFQQPAAATAAEGVNGTGDISTTTTKTTLEPSLNHDSSSSLKIDKIPDEDDTPVCRVVLVNKMDYHYEIIESTILQFPLPWEKLGCNVVKTAATSGQKKPVVVFDVALAEHHKFGNEKKGWIQYFTTGLRGRVRDRSDGLVRAQFGDIVSYMNYTRSYNAIIGISCDSYNFKKWMIGPHAQHFCVLHGLSKFQDAWILERSCWLNPMHERCFFLPTDFPQFPPEEDEEQASQQQQQAKTSINLCVSGGNRRHDVLAQVLANIIGKTNDDDDDEDNTLRRSTSSTSSTTSIRLRILQRLPDIPEHYMNHNLTNMVDIIRTNSFLEFQKAISQCDLMLPLIDPETNKNYFPQGLKKLSGSLPQAIAYKLPTVMHAELYNVYKDHLTAPSRTYTDAASFATALKEMIALLSSSTPAS